MNCSTPGFPVLHCLSEFAQNHIPWVRDAMQTSHPLLPPSPLALSLSSIRVFSNESAHCIRWPKYWRFSFISVLPMNIQVWLPLWLIGLVSLLSQVLSRVFYSTTIQKDQYFAPSLLYGPTLTSIHDYWKSYTFDSTDLVCKVMSLPFNTLSRFIITFLTRSKHLLILWLQSSYVVILEPKKIKPFRRSKTLTICR